MAIDWATVMATAASSGVVVAGVSLWIARADGEFERQRWEEAVTRLSEAVSRPVDSGARNQGITELTDTRRDASRKVLEEMHRRRS